ncbi:unnamed protein product [Toxocara canis]|uniref:Uncharacterized protein n=1 Tax=Toxocara canis TaxID=6265 RepID=A0A183UZ57_TOXCA|nr:unnamed protein product [Toxocara canis]
MIATNANQWRTWSILDKEMAKRDVKARLCLLVITSTSSDAMPIVEMAVATRRGLEEIIKWLTVEAVNDVICG